MLVSIFNDVIGPIMRGPSSSHCAAALASGRLAITPTSLAIERRLADGRAARCGGGGCCSG